MKFTIHGRIPSKKNQKRMICKGNRPLLLSSEKHKEWHKEQSLLIKKYRPKTPFDNCKIKMMFYAPDKRKADLTNKAESVMDLLVDNGFVEDDNWFNVYGIGLGFGGVSKENPRVEIEII